MATWEVVETQTIRTRYRVEADSENDALERYEGGEFKDNDIVETLVSARKVGPADG